MYLLHVEVDFIILLCVACITSERYIFVSCHDVLTTSHNLAYASVQGSVCSGVHHQKGIFLYLMLFFA